MKTKKVIESESESWQFGEWDGSGFRVGDEKIPILSYETSSSGWTDDLTSFHENTAGNSHFIDRASRRYAVSQVARYISGETPVILDIGCSSGFLLSLKR